MTLESSFPEMHPFRDRICTAVGIALRVLRNEAAIAADANPWHLGTLNSCGFLETKALLDALRAGNYDAVIGGARCEEERSRDGVRRGGQLLFAGAKTRLLPDERIDHDHDSSMEQKKREGHF